MADQLPYSLYSCQGTLHVPAENHKRNSWRERLVSGNQITVVLKIFRLETGGAEDQRFFLSGENSRNMKLFEVNLKYISQYFVRTRTWHEITASDRRRFALSFDDTNSFSRFYDNLVCVLKSLTKFTQRLSEEVVVGDGGDDDDDDDIIVLRVAKVSPPGETNELKNKERFGSGNYDNNFCQNILEETPTPPRSPALRHATGRNQGVIHVCNATEVGTTIRNKVADADAFRGRSSPVSKLRNHPTKVTETISSEEDWVCQKCTLINPLESDKCEACGRASGSQKAAVFELTRMPSKYVISSDLYSSLMNKKDEWQCSVCSFANRPQDKNCQACSAWICSHCTLHNTPGDRTCLVCAKSK